MLLALSGPAQQSSSLSRTSGEAATKAREMCNDPWLTRREVGGAIGRGVPDHDAVTKTGTCAIGTLIRFGYLPRLGRTMSVRSRADLVAEWAVPSSASLGSNVRTKGIESEIRARLLWSATRCVTIEAGQIKLQMSGDD
jgi:hypothetical protein